MQLKNNLERLLIIRRRQPMERFGCSPPEPRGPNTPVKPKEKMGTEQLSQTSRASRVRKSSSLPLDVSVSNEYSSTKTPRSSSVALKHGAKKSDVVTQDVVGINNDSGLETPEIKRPTNVSKKRKLSSTPGESPLNAKVCILSIVCSQTGCDQFCSLKPHIFGRYDDKLLQTLPQSNP